MRLESRSVRRPKWVGLLVASCFTVWFGAVHAAPCPVSASEITALAKDVLKISATQCATDGDKNKYKIALAKLLKAFEVYSRTPSCHLFGSAAVAHAMASLETDAKGACMEGSCKQISDQASHLDASMKALTCKSAQELMTYVDLTDQIRGVCSDPALKGSGSVFSPAPPSALFLEFAAKYGPKSCKGAALSCSRDNASCKQAKACQSLVHVSTPVLIHVLADIASAHCAPATAVAHHQEILTDSYNPLVAGLQECKADGYFFDNADNQSPDQLAAQETKTAAECKLTSDCVAKLSEAAAFDSSVLKPLADVSCAGDTHVAQWQSSVASKLSDETTAVQQCISTGHLVGYDANSWPTLRADFDHLKSLCTDSAACLARFKTLQADFSVLQSIASAACPDAKEQQYQSARAHFDQNDVKPGTACYDTYLKDHRSEIDGWHTRLQDGSAGSVVCRFCGVSGRKCCTGSAPCGSKLACFGGSCTECGGQGKPCCVGADPVCGGVVTLQCDGTYCRACGTLGKPCCAKAPACIGDTMQCSANVCSAKPPPPCGAAGAFCHHDSECCSHACAAFVDNKCQGGGSPPPVSCTTSAYVVNTTCYNADSSVSTIVSPGSLSIFGCGADSSAALQGAIKGMASAGYCFTASPTPGCCLYDVQVLPGCVQGCSP